MKPRELDAYAKRNPTFAACRDLGHAWTWDTGRVEVATRAGRVTEFVRVVTCSRCDAERRERIAIQHRRIEKVARTYRYAAGYLIPGGVDRHALRLALFDQWAKTRREDQ
jgi:hypothetical protein